MRQRNVYYLVEVGRGKGSYRPRFDRMSSLNRAMLWYNGINIGNGYKKRLRMTCEVLTQGADRMVWTSLSFTLASYRS